MTLGSYKDLAMTLLKAEKLVPSMVQIERHRVQKSIIEGDSMNNNKVSIENPVAASNVVELKFKRRVNPVHRLPFVGKQDGKLGLSFWAVPKTGGYEGGCNTGRAQALLYLKYLKDRQKESGGTLQNIVLDMFGFYHASTPEEHAFRGQIVGFFSELERWTKDATTVDSDGLDRHSGRQLLQIANAGINSQA